MAKSAVKVIPKSFVSTLGPKNRMPADIAPTAATLHPLHEFFPIGHDASSDPEVETSAQSSESRTWDDLWNQDVRRVKIQMNLYDYIIEKDLFLK